MHEKKRKTDFHSGDRLLMFAFVLGPVAALLDQAVAYALVETACERGSKMILHASMLVFFLVALSAALIGRRYSHEVDEGTGVLSLERTRWLAAVTFYLGIASAIVIVAMEIPNVILRSCD